MSDVPVDPVEPDEPAPAPEPEPERDAPSPVEEPSPPVAATRIPTGLGALNHLSRRAWAEVYRSPVRTRGRPLVSRRR